jgi:hypothetical protein
MTKVQGQTESNQPKNRDTPIKKAPVMDAPKPASKPIKK